MTDERQGLLIAVLERLLEEARSGEIAHLAYVSVAPCGCLEHGCVPGGNDNDAYTLVGGLEAIKVTLLQHVLGGDPLVDEQSKPAGAGKPS
jgi:hypothetical protein